MKSVGWWAIVAVLLIVGFAAMKESVLGALVIVAAAAFASPPIWNAAYSRTGFSYRRALVAALAIGGMIIWANSPEFQRRMAQDQAKRDADNKAAAMKEQNEAAQKAADEKAHPYGDEMKQISWLTASKEAVKERLKDPGSAEFKDVRFYSGGGLPVACGEVNAKNGFGGYSGFEHFIAAGGEMAFLESEVSDFHKAWNKFCVTAPTDNAHTD